MADKDFIEVNIRGRITRIPRPKTERDQWRERFRKVILMAGYGEGYAQKVVDEDLDRQMTDMPKFIAMLEDYETRYAEDGEII